MVRQFPFHLRERNAIHLHFALPLFLVIAVADGAVVVRTVVGAGISGIATQNGGELNKEGTERREETGTEWNGGEFGFWLFPICLIK